MIVLILDVNTKRKGWEGRFVQRSRDVGFEYFMKTAREDLRGFLRLADFANNAMRVSPGQQHVEMPSIILSLEGTSVSTYTYHTNSYKAPTLGLNGNFDFHVSEKDLCLSAPRAYCLCFDIDHDHNMVLSHFNVDRGWYVLRRGLALILQKALRSLSRVIMFSKK